MLVGINESGEYVLADQADNSVQYRCPACFSPLILKKGQYKVAHFSHHRVTDCYKAAYKQESIAHLSGKHYLYDLFSSQHVAMEYYLSEIEQIPDVYVNNHIALELQLSVIPIEMIVNRSLGYRMIGKEVIWIADDRMIKKDRTLKLTAFQRSLIDTKRMRLISYNADDERCYIYKITGVDAHLTLNYTKSVFTRQQLEASSRMDHAVYWMSRGECLKYIHRCRQERSVLQPTLSHLYQLRIDQRKLPDTLGVIVPMQFFVRTHPIEWQSMLMLEMKNGTFHIDAFCRQLKYHTYHLNHHSRIDITKQLIEQYYRAVRNLYVQN